MSNKARRGAIGLRQFLDLDEQQDWIEGKADLGDADARSELLEQRFKYAARVEKLLQRLQAQEVLDVLGLYGANRIPMPRRTEREYWSVSCLPSTSDKPLVRVNASWMELFTLYADGEGIRSRFIVHLSDFTDDSSVMQDRLDEAFLEGAVAAPEDVSHYFPRGADIFIVNVRGAASTRPFMGSNRVLRAIRRFNLTHMNRGRNAYQASHCYGIADYMIGD
ncbi:hypothetical protein [Sphingopyxis macrogoltabida]|uniref:Uncharacterized protein n=1 Tax=Sphingopyxis macrogoltabida TaxID=33050 RepID=A0A0N9V8C3_SPHMC|nr:hypothetical protein [Sphingopyxis macrogoltabida]ALH80527.1 hypothetical protein AN936_09135 [Sphingopyxis macrogoltabida]